MPFFPGDLSLSLADILLVPIGVPVAAPTAAPLARSPRAISGLILALFVTSVSVGVITTMDFNRGSASQGPAARDTVVDQFQAAARGPGAVAPVPAAMLAKLRSVRGV